jgi:hypothetical protein
LYIWREQHDTPQVKGRIEHRLPSEKLCTWKIGGRARWSFGLKTQMNLCIWSTVVKAMENRSRSLAAARMFFFGPGASWSVIVNTHLNKICWQRRISCSNRSRYSLMRLQETLRTEV